MSGWALHWNGVRKLHISWFYFVICCDKVATCNHSRLAHTD